jgi:1-aminocyclopropane-1-carboxylate deaminase/D-cysteine desulfhydrase-like pyridoxal-dependent ACC family enzyme
MSPQSGPAELTGDYANFAATLNLPSPVTALLDDRLARAGVQVWLKRDDLIHPEVPGNKWRKLKYNLIQATRSGHHTLLTFGGAYSNHLRATAAAGRYLGFTTIGVVRGEEHRPLNSSLQFAADRGMELTYLSRDAYRRRNDQQLIDGLRAEFGDYYLLPEGGSNELAVRGCAELPAELDPDFDLICCPGGTGGTLAGIASGLRPGQRALGFSVLKGGEFLARDVARLQQRTYGASTSNWLVDCDFHFGGFARRDARLDAFVADFRARHGLQLDWVYVAKMMYGLVTRAEQGAFEPGSRIVAVVTGPPDPDARQS